MPDDVQSTNQIQPGSRSYRDPAGFLFEENGIIYRQVNKVYREHYDHFINSGCYERLVKTGLLIPHETIENRKLTDEGYALIKPVKIPFISYPYEWSFDMLKDASLITLKIVRECLAHDMILKDASPYNIQWHKGRLVFIDTLSFEKYNEQEPWIAYRQFCESFLAPLMLMHYRRQSLQQLMLAWPDGIPLSITASLLPGKTRWSLHSYLHIHLHARVSDNAKTNREKKIIFSRKKLLDLITSLEVLIKRLKFHDKGSTWSGYYKEASNRGEYLEQKKNIIRKYLVNAGDLQTAIDLGANEGEFSKMLAGRNIQTLSIDLDPYCINRLYQDIKTEKQQNIQPLVIDISNPSPAIGFINEERPSFLDRVQTGGLITDKPGTDGLGTDLILALGLVHHLAIGKNIPLPMLARSFARMSKQWIIEFIPKEDEKLREMLAQKKDIYDQYDQAGFESAFNKYFKILSMEKIPGSARLLYHMSTL